MKVYIDQGAQHALTKRMLPHWTELGVEIVPLVDAQIHLAFVNFTAASKLPKILRLDGIYYNLAMPYMMENRPIMKAYKEALGIIFQSNYSKKVAEAFFGQTLTPNRIIYNGADPSWNDPLPQENFNIVMASHWRKWKRLEEMLNLLDELVAFYPEIKLHVVGKGKDIDLKGKYNHVNMYGDLDHEKMRELYRRMDLAIHIAKRDWCPNVVVEFLAAGMPTIVSDCGGGAAELVDKVDHQFVAMDDYDPQDILPVAQYSKEWNKLHPDFKTNVQSKIQMVIKGWLPKRVTLPEELTAKYAATQYYEFMRSFI